VLRLAVVATRGARLALEILEPGFQLRPFMVVMWWTAPAPGNEVPLG
jgi:hypothetical protein